jgi:hypothetical protein
MADAAMMADNASAIANKAGRPSRILLNREYQVLFFIAHTPLVRKKEITTSNQKYLIVLTISIATSFAGVSFQQSEKDQDHHDLGSIE